MNTRKDAVCKSVIQTNNGATASLWGKGGDPTFTGAPIVPLTSLEVQDASGMLENTASTCSTNPQKSETVLQDVQVSLGLDLPTQGCEETFYQAMFGFEEVVGEEIGESGKFPKLFGFYPYGVDSRKFTAEEISDDLGTATDTVFPYFHAAQAWGDQDILVKNIALNDWTLTANSGEALQLSASGIAQKVIRLTDPSRVSSSWVAPTSPNYAKRFRLLDCTATQFGKLGSLASKDLFGIEIAANLGRTGGDPNSSTGDTRSEPVVNNLTEIVTTLTIGRVDIDFETYQSWMKSDETVAFSATFERGGDKLSVCIPAAQIVSVEADLGDIPKTVVTIKAVNPKTSEDPFVALRGGVDLRYRFPIYFVVTNNKATNSMVRM